MSGKTVLLCISAIPVVYLVVFAFVGEMDQSGMFSSFLGGA